jgi:transcriptional regulator with XRE-family HTH domain
MTFGEILKQRRKKAGMTQKELAKALGITYMNISQIENGHRMPRPQTILRIANALGDDAIDLLRIAPSKEAKERAEEMEASFYDDDIPPVTTDDSSRDHIRFMEHMDMDIEEHFDELRREITAEENPEWAREYEEEQQAAKRAAAEARAKSDALEIALLSFPVGQYSTALILLERAFMSTLSAGTFRPRMDKAKKQRYITADISELTFAEVGEMLEYMKELIFFMRDGSPGNCDVAMRLFENAFGKRGAGSQGVQWAQETQGTQTTQVAQGTQEAKQTQKGDDQP